MGAKTLLAIVGSALLIGSAAAVATAAQNGPAGTNPISATAPADTVAPKPTAPLNEASTKGELSVTYLADSAATITTVVLAEGGGAVANATLESAVAHHFELPAGTYLVDVTQSSGVEAHGDVAISSASALRSGPVVVTAGALTSLSCTPSGCEVR